MIYLSPLYQLTVYIVVLQAQASATARWSSLQVLLAKNKSHLAPADVAGIEDWFVSSMHSYESALVLSLGSLVFSIILAATVANTRNSKSGSNT